MTWRTRTRSGERCYDTVKLRPLSPLPTLPLHPCPEALLVVSYGLGLGEGGAGAEWGGPTGGRTKEARGASCAGRSLPTNIRLTRSQEKNGRTNCNARFALSVCRGVPSGTRRWGGVCYLGYREAWFALWEVRGTAVAVPHVGCGARARAIAMPPAKLVLLARDAAVAADKVFS